MKKYVSISLFIFFAIVIAILVANLIFSNQKQKAPIVASSSATTLTTANQIILTFAEVAKHNNANSCWSIINGSVYNLTSLINTHSGGASAILQTCGTDGSSGFNTKYGRGSHSGSAQNILQSFLIGPLGQ